MGAPGSPTIGHIWEFPKSVSWGNSHTDVCICIYVYLSIYLSIYIYLDLQNSQMSVLLHYAGWKKSLKKIAKIMDPILALLCLYMETLGSGSRPGEA